jgi:hypothetical protein
MSDNFDCKNIIIPVVIVFFIVALYLLSNKEGFRANNINIKDVNVNMSKPDYENPSLPYTSLYLDQNTRNVISKRDLTDIVDNVREIIINDLVKYGKICQEMNGDEVKMADGNYALSLMCNNNPWEIEKEIVNNIVKSIRDIIQKRFNINMNPYLLYHDISRNLNLLEGVIYPLQYSGLYTIHGIQYINKDVIRNKVNRNLDIKDTLLTALSRRDIILH